MLYSPISIAHGRQGKDFSTGVKFLAIAQKKSQHLFPLETMGWHHYLCLLSWQCYTSWILLSSSSSSSIDFAAPTLNSSPWSASTFSGASSPLSKLTNRSICSEILSTVSFSCVARTISYTPFARRKSRPQRVVHSKRSVSTCVSRRM